MLAWDYYIIKESKNKFKDWTQAGLEHLRKHYKNGQVTKSPLLLIDESNIKYKMFYELKTLKGNIHIPLAYKEKYHQKCRF